MLHSTIMDPNGGGRKSGPRSWQDLLAVLFVIGLFVLTASALNKLIPILNTSFVSPNWLTYLFVAILALLAGFGVYAFRTWGSGSQFFGLLEVAVGTAIVTTAVFPPTVETGLARLIAGFGGLRISADGIKRIIELRHLKPGTSK